MAHNQPLFHKLLADIRNGKIPVHKTLHEINIYDNGIRLPNAGITDQDCKALMRALKRRPENAAKITEIDLSGNRISEIELFAGLTNLDTLLLDNNRIKSITIPDECVRLRYLSLKRNRLTELNISSKLINLRVLSVAGNALTSLNIPAGLSKLREVFAGSNRISSINLPASARMSMFSISTPGNLVRETDLHPISALSQIIIRAFVTEKRILLYPIGWLEQSTDRLSLTQEITEHLERYFSLQEILTLRPTVNRRHRAMLYANQENDRVALQAAHTVLLITQLYLNQSPYGSNISETIMSYLLPKPDLKNLLHAHTHSLRTIFEWLPAHTLFNLIRWLLLKLNLLAEPQPLSKYDIMQILNTVENQYLANLTASHEFLDMHKEKLNKLLDDAMNSGKHKMLLGFNSYCRANKISLANAAPVRVLDAKYDFIRSLPVQGRLKKRRKLNY